MRIKALLMPVAAVIVAAAVLFGLSAGLSGLRNENVQKIIKNGVKWACPVRKNIVLDCPHVAPLENIEE